MPAALPLRFDFDSQILRGLVRRCEDCNQSRRLLSLAAVYDGMSRTEAARIGGMDRQTLRHWVLRFNKDGPEGLFDRWSPGPARRLIPKEVGFDPFDGVKSAHSARRGAPCDAVYRASAGTTPMGGFGPPKAGFSWPPDVVMLPLWSTRPRRKACLAGGRENPVKWVNRIEMCSGALLTGLAIAAQRS